MANRDIICYDFETGGRNPDTCQPTQLAAIALDGRTLRKKGEFQSMIRAEIDDDKAIAAGLGPLEEGALKITGHTREQIDAAPSLESVWKRFGAFCLKYNWKKTPFFAPIPCGYNIIGYDNVITKRLCKLYGPWSAKDDCPTMFSKVFKIDVMDMMYMWTEADPEVKSINMAALRKRFGMSSEGAHDALQDVKDTANIMIKMLRTHRAVYKNLEIDDCFKGKDLFIQ
jgi:DNA polymerase III epsilon subunit-like protein